MPEAERQNPSTHGLNIVPFASMAGGWLGPLLMFWLYIWGPLRPFAYEHGHLLPSAWFVLVPVACVSLWWLLPRAYYEIRTFERTGRIYRAVGVLLFRRFAPNGDLANRWERRANPNFRVIGGRRAATDFVERTKDSERGHMVLLALGMVSAVYAWRIGWHGWAYYLSAGNVLVNVYPILLQRYTRARLCRVLQRS